VTHHFHAPTADHGLPGDPPRPEREGDRCADCGGEIHHDDAAGGLVCGCRLDDATRRAIAETRLRSIALILGVEMDAVVTRVTELRDEVWRLRAVEAELRNQRDTAAMPVDDVEF
jgi:hypothetical protein